MKKKAREDPLHVLWAGDPHAIEKLLGEKGLDLDRHDAQGRTLLMEAVLEKRLDLVTLLLSHGADPRRHDLEGWTALHFAAQAQLPDIVQALLDKGAEVDAKDNLAETPLFKALSSYRGQADGNAIWALLLTGADRSVKNSHGVSPEDLAKRPSNYDLGQFLA
ncbi:MAG: ankyrin repeat domain-containing protein [Myxococcaceae bacterium]|nr:ankyrin repeat domain-containing protein [Myxococcaceae bacterium]